MFVVRLILILVGLLSIEEINGFSRSGVARRKKSISISSRNKRKQQNVDPQGFIPSATNTDTSVDDIKNNEGNNKISFLTIKDAYRGVSIAYSTQVMMALFKSGPTLFWANVICGPALAGALTWILSKDKEGNLDDVSSKLMNGTLMLYSSLCLVLVGLVPRLGKPFGLLYMTTGASTLLVAAKGYCKDFPNGGRFLEETKKIMPRIHKANLYALPKDVPNVLYMVCMINVILLKAGILTDIMNLSVFSRGIMASKVSSIAKLTLLGGSIVALRDAANYKLLGQSRFRTLNLFVSYVFGSMAALEFFKVAASPKPLTICLHAISAVACLKNAFFP